MMMMMMMVMVMMILILMPKLRSIVFHLDKEFACSVCF